MLRRYIVKNKVIIPYTNNRYVIHINGDIIDTETDIKISDSTTKFVEIFILNKWMRCDLNWLIAISFKPVYNSESFILNWDLLFVDDNPDNFHPSNLIWRPPSGGQPCPENKEFNVIPGFSYYGINEIGDLYFRLTKTIRVVKKINDPHNLKYKSCSVRLDNGERVTIPHHRALCLAFKKYENNVNNMTVDHVNGIKLFNELSNLEWVSYGENNKRARDNGLCNTRKKVLLKDHYTNEITEFLSISHLAEFLSINSGWLIQQINEYPNKPIDFRYSARLKDSNIPWPLFSKEDLIKRKVHFLKHKQGLECYARNVYTNELFIAKDRGQLGQLIGLTRHQVKTGLNSIYPWPSFGYIFGYINNPREERKFEADELIAYKDRSGIKNPVRVTFPDNNTKVYVSPSELSLELGMTCREMTDKLYSGYLKYGSPIYKTNEYTVEYIK